MLHLGAGGRTAQGTHPLTIGLASWEAGGQEDPGGSGKPKAGLDKLAGLVGGNGPKTLAWPWRGSDCSPGKQHPGSAPPSMP